tara:strand:- start:4299 stop:5111 length:813 start_codon:yes stop_codon:yes gene_type:complete
MQAQTGTGPFAEVGTLPEIEARTRPQYVELDLQSLQHMLGGVNGQPGLLEQYAEVQPRLSELENADKETRAAADLEVLQRYGKATADAVRDASGSGDLLAALEEQALSELAAGSELDDSTRKEIQRAVRSGQSARGFGLGENDALMEALQTGDAAYRRRRERQALASSVANQLQASGGDPLLALLGRSSGAVANTVGVGSQAYGQSQNLGPTVYNPESGYAADLYRSNREADLAARTATAANRASIAGGALSMFGAMGGGLLGNSGLFRG